jgi:hypothetical protein
MQSDLCLHCEQQARATHLGLCAACNDNRNIHVLYRRRRGWTPEWEAHLCRLTARARLRLPLFGPDLPEVPARHRHTRETAEERLARLRKRLAVEVDQFAFEEGGAA